MWVQLLLLFALCRPSKAFDVIVVGGSSGMGKAAAISVLKRGGDVLVVSRTQEKLASAAEEIQTMASTVAEKCDRIGTVKTATLDASSESEVKAFAASLEDGKWDGLVFSAAGKAPHGPIETLDTALTRELFDTKFWGAYHCAKHIAPRLKRGGAVVFLSGVLNRRPGINCSPLASTNGALEGLTRSLALEFGPKLRVNCMSPGFCDTERFDHMDPDRKKAMLANTADSLPLKRVGRPSDMGEAIHFLLTAPFCTGAVLDVDGGHGIRQYANPNSDPMRNR